MQVYSLMCKNLISLYDFDNQTLVYIFIYQASRIFAVSDMWSRKHTSFYILHIIPRNYHMVCVIIDLCCMFLLQINKPYLPLASGEYSFATGAIIVVSSSILVPYRFIPFFTDILQDELY